MIKKALSKIDFPALFAALTLFGVFWGTIISAIAEYSDPPHDPHVLQLIRAHHSIPLHVAPGEVCYVSER